MERDPQDVHHRGAASPSDRKELKVQNGCYGKDLLPILPKWQSSNVRGKDRSQECWCSRTGCFTNVTLTGVTLSLSVPAAPYENTFGMNWSLRTHLADKMGLGNAFFYF